MWFRNVPTGDLVARVSYGTQGDSTRIETGVRKPAGQAFANCRMSFTSRIG
jgi:hypothetical protein